MSDKQQLKEISNNKLKLEIEILKKSMNDMISVINGLSKQNKYLQTLNKKLVAELTQLQYQVDHIQNQVVNMKYEHRKRDS